MGWANKLIGWATGNGVEVDANHNLLVNMPITKTQAGYLSLLFEIDSGVLTGVKYVKSPIVSEDKRLNVGMDTPMFDYTFNATSQNTAIWRFAQATTTMAATQGSGYLTLNSGSVLTANAACALQTWRSFPLRGNASQHEEMFFNISSIPLANQVFEWGYAFNSAAGAAPVAPTDGLWMRLTSAGLIGVLCNNGVETPTGVIVAAASIPINTNLGVKFIVSENVVEFWYNGNLASEVTIPAANGQLFMTTSLPQFVQARNTGAVTGTPCIIKFSDTHTDQDDLNLNKPYGVQQCCMGLSAYQGQDGGTMGSTSMYSNAALAVAAALTNTTAAAGSIGLGGTVLVLPTLTAGTDGILFSWLNPSGGINQTPRTFICTGVKISSGVQTVLVGGQLNLVFGIAYGHTALSLATTESGSFVAPTTKAPRRIPIGVQNYIAAAAAGVGAQDLTLDLKDGPAIVNPGEYFAFTMRNVGVVTTSGALVITATPVGYFQ